MIARLGIATASVFGLLFTAFSLSSAQAAPATKSLANEKIEFTKDQAIGDWKLRCANLPDGKGAKREVCALVAPVASVKTKDNKQVPVLTVEVLKDMKKNKPVLGVSVPLGINLTQGVTISLPDGTTKKSPFNTCFGMVLGCKAGVELDDAFMKKFENAAKFTVTYSDLSGAPFSVDMKNGGFSKGVTQIK